MPDDGAKTSSGADGADGNRAISEFDEIDDINDGIGNIGNIDNNGGIGIIDDNGDIDDFEVIDDIDDIDDIDNIDDIDDIDDIDVIDDTDDIDDASDFDFGADYTTSKAQLGDNADFVDNEVFASDVTNITYSHSRDSIAGSMAGPELGSGTMAGPESGLESESESGSRAGASRFLWPALAFFIPFAIHAIAFAVIDVSPFGGRTKSMMVIDNFHQYSPFLLEFRDILKSGGSLLYSWNSGLGSNYWARYAYYLASPLNLLFVFFPARSLPEFIVFLSLIRTGISGLSFYAYLRGKQRHAMSTVLPHHAPPPYHTGIHIRIAGVIFATMYAVSAYTLAYYWNIMWFDCIALLPLVALGLERIARGRGGVLYCIALAVVMYTNYYVALIICIFACVYFIAYSAAEANFTLRGFALRALRFTGYSALAAGLSAVILLPTWSALAVSQSAGAKFPARLEFYYNALEILSGHLFNIKPSVMSGKPNIYCGTVALILIPLYFINKKFSIREKAAYGILLTFIMLSCNINYLNFLWHGMHFPNSLPYRFTFAYVFVVAALCFKAYANLDGVSRGAAYIILAAAVSYVLILEKLAPDIATPGVLYPSLALLGMNAAAVAWAARAESPYTSRLAVPAAAIVLLLLTTIELSVNAGFGIGAAGIGQRGNYMADIDEVREAVAAVGTLTGTAPSGVGINAGTDSSDAGEYDFYRMEFLKDTVSNTPSLYDYRGASYFSSTAVLKVTDLMGKLGFRPSSAWYIYKGSTPVINSMLSLRYLLSKEDTYDNPLYPNAGEINGINVYENPYSLPLGFFADKDIMSLSLNQSNIFKIQNDFIKRAAGFENGIRDVLLPVEINHKESKNAEITSRSGNLYHFRVLNTSEPGYINFTINANSPALTTGANPISILVGGIDDRSVNGNLPAPASAPPTITAPIFPAAADATTPATTPATTLATTPATDSATAPATASPTSRQRPLYLYIQSRQIDYIWFIKGNQSEGHNIKYYPYIIDMQYFGDADEIEISLKMEENATGDFEMYASYFDEAEFAGAISIINSHPLEIDSFTDTKVTGTIRAEKPGILFTTIPFDRGWSVRLNGSKLPPEKIEQFGEGFIALSIGAGANRVEFSYMPPNFITGLAISLFSLVALCTLAIFYPIYTKRPIMFREGRIL